MGSSHWNRRRTTGITSTCAHLPSSFASLQQHLQRLLRRALRENGEELGKLFHYGRTVCGAVSEAIAKARIVIADMERLSMGEEATLLVAAVEEYVLQKYGRLASVS
jgi:hypothetical protein